MRPRFYNADPADQLAMGLYLNSESFRDSFTIAIESHKIAAEDDGQLIREYAAASVPPSPGEYRDYAKIRADLDLRNIEIDVMHASADSYAGNLLVQLNDLLQSYGHRIKVTPLALKSTYGPKTRGVPLSAALNAGANNYRHGRAWSDLPFPYPSSDSRTYPSISLVQAVLGRADRLEDHVTAVLLRDISGDSYTQLIEGFISAATDMASSVSTETLTKLQEALTKANRLAATRRASKIHQARPV